MSQWNGFFEGKFSYDIGDYLGRMHEFLCMGVDGK